jgi:YidC/Oxa1 family membrane protein insertase
VKRNKWLLFLALALAVLVLAGCGVSYSGADVVNDPPQGLWQTLVVWPLARALIWLDTMLREANVFYHWGFAIILFTFIVKIVTFPLTIQQMRGMQAQKNLQPKIQELQKKYGKDREKLSQEQMKLYQEAGVNPLSGCLPLLVQMPILFGLYAALVAIGPNLDNAAFFWIPDLGFPTYNGGTSWITDYFSQGQYGLLIAYLILPILLMVTQFIMQKWMTPPTPDGGDNPTAGMTKQISLMMTFMFGFFTLTVPAGLTLYWVTSNLLQMLQQWVITNERFGLVKSTPAPSKPTGSSQTDKPKQITDEPRTANPASATVPVVNNGIDPDTKAKDAKELRRRRAKRR